MKNILVYIPSFGRTSYIEGITSFIVNLYEFIDRDKYNFTIISWGDTKNPLEEKILDLGGKIIYKKALGEGLKSKIKRVKETVSVLKQNKYDALYINTSVPYAHMFAFKVKRKVKGIQTIVHSHSAGFGDGKFTFLKKLLGVFSKSFERYDDIKIACSEKASKFLFSKRANKKNCVAILNNGVNTERFKFSLEKRKLYREKLGLDKEFTLINVGGFNSNKNQAFIIDLLSQMVKENGNVKLLLIGEGKNLDNCKNYALEKGVGDKVVFLGASNQVEGYLTASDCFVLASKSEGFSIVTLEAQCSGLHCVVSDCVPKEVNVTGRVDYLSLTDDKTKWISAINKRYDRHINAPSDIIKEGYSVKNSAIYFEGLLK